MPTATRFAAVDQFLEKNLEKSLDELSRLVAQPSIAAQNLGMEACAELVAQMLRARGFTTEVTVFATNPVD